MMVDGLGLVLLIVASVAEAGWVDTEAAGAGEGTRRE